MAAPPQPNPLLPRHTRWAERSTQSCRTRRCRPSWVRPGLGPSPAVPGLGSGLGPELGSAAGRRERQSQERPAGQLAVGEAAARRIDKRNRWYGNRQRIRDLIEKAGLSGDECRSLGDVGLHAEPHNQLAIDVEGDIVLSFSTRNDGGGGGEPRPVDREQLANDVDVPPG